MQAAYQAGIYPTPGWEVLAEQQASMSTTELYRAIWLSFAIAMLALLATSVALLLYSRFSLESPLSVGKVLGAIGTFLGSWATLFELGTPVRTWKGKSLPELIHPKIFISLFVPGLLFIFLGQLW